ncbi:MAG: HAD family hydrolase [Bdellovibrionia bacterium]
MANAVNTKKASSQKSSQITKKFKERLQITHLLMDLDGTLVGAKDFPVTIDFLKRTLPEMKRHGTWLDTLRAVRAMHEELQTPSKMFTNNVRATRAFADSMGITFEKADQFLTKTLTTHFPLLERHFFPIPGAEKFLSWAKDYYPLILATNPVWKEDIVKLRIKWANLDPLLFQSMTHSEKMHACKPSAEYYREILEQEGLSPGQCMLIGNDPKKDLPAALVGIPVFILTNSKVMEQLVLKGQTAPAWAGSFLHVESLLLSHHKNGRP